MMRRRMSIWKIWRRFENECKWNRSGRGSCHVWNERNRRACGGKNFADEISKAAARLETEEPDSGKSITKMRPMGDNVGKTSELEDKYCSLCGSMIKEDGSCPMCGVPTFISSNGRAGNQRIAQAASSQSVSGSPKIRMR